MTGNDAAFDGNKNSNMETLQNSSRRKITNSQLYSKITYSLDFNEEEQNTEDFNSILKLLDRYKVEIIEKDKEISSLNYKLEDIIVAYNKKGSAQFIRDTKEQQPKSVETESNV